MTGKEIVDSVLGLNTCKRSHENSSFRLLANAIDAALDAERARCQAAIWEHRGKCASDQAAKALMEEMERTP